MALSIEEIGQLAQRSRLSLSEKEARLYAEDLTALEKEAEALLRFFGPLGDVEDEPMGLSQMREDVPSPCTSREKLLELSSLREGDCIAVPCAVKEA